MFAVRNVFRRPGRTILTVIGISLSIGLAICIFSLSAGIEISIHNILDERGVDVYVVPKGVPVFLQDFFPPLTDSRDISRSLLKNRNITAAGPRLIDSIYITSMDTNDFRDIRAEDEAEWDELKIFHSIGRGRIPEMDGNFGGEKMIKGKYLPTLKDPFYQNGTYKNGENSTHFTHEMVLDEGLADHLGVGVGDRVYVSKDFPQRYDEIMNWSTRTIYFEVVGIIRENYEGKDMLSCVLHLSEMQYLLGLTKFDSATKIYVQIDEKSDAAEVCKWIEDESAFGTELSAYTKEEFESELIQFTEVMKSFGEMITVITTVVSIIFVATVVVISVKERTKEIGILKAIGISSGSVVRFFLLETFILCILGYLFGILLGIIGVHLVDYMIISSYDHIPPGVIITKITANVIGRVTLFAFAISVMGAVVPSYLTSRVPPITAIRSV